MMIRLIPNIFFSSLSEGLDLFVDGLGFEVTHQDEKFAIVVRDGARAYLHEDAEYAAKDRPEVTIETDTIDELYAEIKARRPEMLHPNARTVEVKPWGSREFAVLDRTGVCVILRQPVAA